MKINNKIKFILNPNSGVNRKPEKIVGWIKEILSPEKQNFEISYTRAPGDATNIAKNAVENGFKLVVAVGGDGTINEVASGLINSNAVLGVIPAGSGNGFARNFNIPLNQKQAIETLLSPKIIKIDAGKINDHYFFNVAGTGLDAEISQNFEKFGLRGPLPYFWIGFKTFLRFKPLHLKIISKKIEKEISPVVVSIANVPQYGNGAIIAPQAIPDDGMLNVCVFKSINFVNILRAAYHLFNGTIDKMPEYETFTTEELKIERSQKAPIHTDGNPLEESAVLHIQVLPGAIKLAIPGNR